MCCAGVIEEEISGDRAKGGKSLFFSLLQMLWELQGAWWQGLTASAPGSESTKSWKLK